MSDEVLVTFIQHFNGIALANDHFEFPDLLGAADRFNLVYYPKYAMPDKRPLDDKELPDGLSMEEYFPYANIDAPMHYFKGNVAVPWLRKVLGE